ncbi:MAG: Archaeal glycosylation protein Q [Microgenomates group bacterium GW2011_GWC1_37_8]|nr:MAG: Archaeal glycosylation protein Q [Microgenomates group bacterium GW2011_GWC1_37_8]
MANTPFSLISFYALKYLPEILRQGFASPGRNGPYNDEDTAVRNSAHWLMTYGYMYEITKQRRYLQAAKLLANFLQKSALRPFGYTFECRRTAAKDRCNGLIGQAWVIESLVNAGKLLHDISLIRLAIKIFWIHPFNTRHGLWHRVEITGKKLSLDPTLNHQIWFAAAASQIGDQNINTRVNQFLNKLVSNFEIDNQGLIYHPILNLIKPKIFGMDINIPVSGYEHQKYLTKSIGYHAFNLYALALLKQNYSSHNFWEHENLKTALEYSLSPAYQQALINNIYGYPYNPVGYELPFIFRVFFPGKNFTLKEWLTKQTAAGNNTVDLQTYDARIYELTRV